MVVVMNLVNPARFLNSVVSSVSSKGSTVQDSSGQSVGVPKPSSMGVKRRSVAIALAFSGAFLPGLHKFYLGQRGWGVAYLLLGFTHIPQVASIIEGLWYGILAQDEFDHNFNPPLMTQENPQGANNSVSPSAASTVNSTANSTVDNVRSRIQNDSTYRLQSPEEVAIAASLGVEIDVNRATVADWLRLPILTEGQGRSLATLNQAGVQFHCLDDLAAALSLSVEDVQPLEPILKFYYYDVDEVSVPTQVNPNQASLATLSNIPGITIPLALQITHHRASKPFQDIADMQQRLSLKAATVERLMHYLQF
ncbi:MAG: helix-hairpin-helix domain-containing protein [Leptolyngbyaceae bacterium]|nr:helix-hairpin-helix domain-containing protein [Leptolyngbyaceae bacterium]